MCLIIICIENAKKLNFYSYNFSWISDSPPVRFFNYNKESIKSRSFEVTWDKPNTYCEITSYNISWKRDILWDNDVEGKVEFRPLGGELKLYIEKDATPYSNYTNICISANTTTNKPSEKTCISGFIQTKDDGEIKFFYTFYEEVKCSVGLYLKCLVYCNISLINKTLK